MQVSIATVNKLEGTVSAIDILGNKRSLSIGEELFLDEIVKTTGNSVVELQVLSGDLFHLESLQSVKLTAEVSPNEMSDSVDAVLNSNLPMGVVEQLFSSYPLISESLGVSSILADIEPVYNLTSTKPVQMIGENINLALNDIFQHSNVNESLDNYLRFDQVNENTVVYFSNQGKFSDLIDTELSADKVLTINSIGYTSSAELLSYLIDSYSVIDPS